MSLFCIKLRSVSVEIIDPTQRHIYTITDRNIWEMSYKQNLITELGNLPSFFLNTSKLMVWIKNFYLFAIEYINTFYLFT